MTTHYARHREMELDSSTLVIIGTLLAGVVGIVAFLMMPQPEKKKRSAAGGLKPRGELLSTTADPFLIIASACASHVVHVRVCLRSQRTCTRNRREPFRRVAHSSGRPGS